MDGAQSNAPLVESLAEHRKKLHSTLRRGLLRLAGPFPLAGPAHWSNDWHAYRPCPYPHVHEGLDLIAPRGTPIVAVANATVTQMVVDPDMAGLGVEIAHGSVQYFYAHMDTFAQGLRVGERVRLGQVLGYVGNSGNAMGGVTHLHFEVQPGGVPVPPKPYVDRWLLKAERRLHEMIRSSRGAGKPHRKTAGSPVRTFLSRSLPPRAASRDTAPWPVRPQPAPVIPTASDPTTAVPLFERFDSGGGPNEAIVAMGGLGVGLVLTAGSALGRRRRPITRMDWARAWPNGCGAPAMPATSDRHPISVPVQRRRRRHRSLFRFRSTQRLPALDTLPVDFRSGIASTVSAGWPYSPLRG
jgi:murein DD-endopeptidase MepM/ murein hydrolase activator NlpD